MRRSDICLHAIRADRSELKALLGSRNRPRQLAWQAENVLATTDGQGTVEIKRLADMLNPTLRHLQEQYLEEGVQGLKHDKTRPSQVRLSPERFS